MFKKNLLRRFASAQVLVNQVVTIQGLSTTQKSAYYRAILLILSSVVEGLVYEIVKNHTTPPGYVFQDSVEYKEVCKIKSSVLGTSTDVHLYQRIKNQLTINDEGATFARLNLFLKHKNLVTRNQYTSIESVRKERNKIHVQSLDYPDIHYTYAKIQSSAKVVHFLFSKV